MFGHRRQVVDRLAQGRKRETDPTAGQSSAASAQLHFDINCLPDEIKAAGLEPSFRWCYEEYGEDITREVLARILRAHGNGQDLKSCNFVAVLQDVLQSIDEPTGPSDFGKTTYDC